MERSIRVGGKPFQRNGVPCDSFTARTNIIHDKLTFVTPYWAGHEMMRLHLESVRQFCPRSPILVSKKGGGKEEMDALASDFGVSFWLEECDYVDALLRLLHRCETEYVCITDHDTVLLAAPDGLLEGLARGEWDLVGVEERIRECPEVDWRALASQYDGWMRFAPGYMDATFLMFNLERFKHRWGLRGVGTSHPRGTLEGEYHYGICEKLRRHKYLRPYHTARYGMGNLLMDDDIPIVWHQWYGSYAQRLGGSHAELTAGDLSATIELATRGQANFLADYPHLDFGGLQPAWGPELDIEAERRMVARAYPGPWRRAADRLSRWRRFGMRELMRRGLRRVARWRLLVK
jgi:hypothetical protein